MTAKITELTPQQEAELPAFRAKYLDLATGGHRANREKLHDALTEAYAILDQPKPLLVIMPSPFSAMVAIAALKGMTGESLRDQLRDQLRGQFGGQLWDQLWDQLGDQLRGQVSNSFAAAHWCAAEVFYDFCRQIGVNYSAVQNSLLNLWLLQSRRCHWWFPYKGVVLASERHNALSIDAEGRLHSLTGLACGYPDGWGVYAVHGVRVPRYIIEEPHKITVAEIDAEKNSEVRRVMIERYGLGRFLLDAGAKEIHSDDYGTLFRREIAGDEPLVMVKVVNSTAEPDGSFKDYFLRVPPAITKARDAVAWTFDVSPEEYAVEAQT